VAKTIIDPRPPTRIPLVGTNYKRDSSTSVTSDQYFQNCAFTKRVNPETNQETIITSKRLGLTAVTSVTSVTAAIDSLYMPAFYHTAPIILWDNGADAILKKADTTITTFTGYGTGSCSRMTPCFSASPTTHAVLLWNISTGGSRTAKYYPNGGSVTSISDVDFPASSITGNFVFMDGYAFIMTEDGYIYNSELNDLDTWLATSYLTAGFKADDGVTCARYKSKLVAFGRESTEFFENVGNATGSPLQKIPEAGFKIGMYKDDTSSTYSATSACKRYIEAFDTLFWISGSYGDQSAQAIYYLENYKPQRLTTPDIESIFSYDGLDQIIGTFNYGGEPCIMVKTVDGNYYVCFISYKLWSKWVFGTGTPVNIGGGAGQIVYADLGTKQVKLTFADQTLTSFQDDSNDYSLVIQTNKVDGGTERRKRLHKLALIGNDAAATSTTTVSWSDDDYTTFSTARSLDMNSTRPYLSNCGAFRRRAFKITNSSNAPFELEGLELELSVLTK
jgi:hypothetical protein